LVAPAGTPETIVRKVSEDLRKVMTDPTLGAQLAGRGSYPLPMSPAEVTAFIRDQQQQWSPVLQQIAAKP
jgi:tripartite-type tricarboxylate transporter receptor subunit TctC